MKLFNVKNIINCIVWMDVKYTKGYIQINTTPNELL